MFRLSRTCKLGRLAVQDYVTRAYDINSLFNAFFEDVPAFRRLQAQTGAIVSGSLALQFLDRTRYPGTDCDLYVTAKHAKEIGEWIVANDGAGRAYRFAPSEKQASSFDVAIKELYAQWISFSADGENDTNVEDEGHVDTYVSKHVTGVYTFVSDKNGAIVQMVVTNSSPIDAITHFHSTVVMNAITHKAAYSFFPCPTFELHKNAVCRDATNDDVKRLLEKYRERGWDYFDSLSQYPNPPERWFRDLFQYRKPRWVGDEYCWTLPLEALERVENESEDVGSETAEPARKLLDLGGGVQDIKKVDQKEVDLIVLNGWTLSWVGEIESNGKFALLTDELRAYVLGEVYQIPREYRRCAKTFVHQLNAISLALPDEYSDARLDLELLRLWPLHEHCKCPVYFSGVTGTINEALVAKHRWDCELERQVQDFYRGWPSQVYESRIGFLLGQLHL